MPYTSHDGEWSSSMKMLMTGGWFAVAVITLDRIHVWCRRLYLLEKAYVWTGCLWMSIGSINRHIWDWHTQTYVCMYIYIYIHCIYKNYVETYLRLTYANNSKYAYIIHIYATVAQIDWYNYAIANRRRKFGS